MSLIELHPDFTKIAKELSRIANALERICLANAIPLTDPKPDDSAELTYSTDEGLLRDELQEMVDRMRPGGGVNKPIPADEDEDE